jgi:hypothetical protein
MVKSEEHYIYDIVTLHVKHMINSIAIRRNMFIFQRK